MPSEPMVVAESLGQVLHQFMLSVEEMLRLKGRGRQLMSQGDLEGLMTIISAQEGMVYRLKALEAQRRALGLRLSLEAFPETILGRHQALGERLVQLRSANEQDALLIAAFSRLHEEQRRFIEWLHGGSMAYEADGQPRDGPSPQGVSFDQKA